MIDPTSDVGKVDEDEAPACEVCGDPIIEDSDHRVITWINDDNHVEHRHFCSDDCASAWEDEHGDSIP